MNVKVLIGHKRFRLLLAILLIWAAAAYLLLPWLWKQYFRHYPGYSGVSCITQTADKHPGDPVNIAIVGTEEQLIRTMTAAGWFPADPITFGTSVRIVVDSVFRKPDDNAPVSNLYLFGRKEDLAFEQPLGNSPRQRHHVRFWLWDKQEDGRPVWFGSATFDKRVGLSYTTAQVTHHIGSDVDAERDLISTELQQAKWEQQLRYVRGFQKPEGRNGGGDQWRSDGRLAVVYLNQNMTAPASPAKNAVKRFR
jgi:hypothetical protein